MAIVQRNCIPSKSRIVLHSLKLTGRFWKIDQNSSSNHQFQSFCSSFHWGCHLFKVHLWKGKSSEPKLHFWVFILIFKGVWWFGGISLIYIYNGALFGLVSYNLFHTYRPIKCWGFEGAEFVVVNWAPVLGSLTCRINEERKNLRDEIRFAAFSFHTKVCWKKVLTSRFWFSKVELFRVSRFWKKYCWWFTNPAPPGMYI